MTAEPDDADQTPAEATEEPPGKDIPAGPSLWSKCWRALASLSEDQATGHACTVCKGNIEPGARKCKHCDSHQWWCVRVLPVAVQITIIVSAIFACVGLRDSFFPSSRTAYVLAQDWVADRDILTVIAVNEGKRSARVLRATVNMEAPESFRLPEGNDDRDFEQIFTVEEDGLIGPQKHKLLKFELTSWDPRFHLLGSYDSEWHCTLTITEVDSNGRVQHRDVWLEGNPSRLPFPIPPSLTRCSRLSGYMIPRINKGITNKAPDPPPE